MNKAFFRTTLYILSGILIGYFFLHPASYIIIDLSNGEIFNFVAILKKSFALSHLTMALYFMLLGGLIGFLFVLYYNLENKFYSDFTEINIQLDDRSKELINKIDHESEDINIFIKQIWPTLNKIQTGVNLIVNDKDDMSIARKKDILSVTKENISSVFNLIDVMIVYGEKET